VGRDLLLSIILHAVIVAATIFASPLDIRKPSDFADVIRVGVVSMPEVEVVPAEPIPEAVTPQAVQAEPEEIALQDPTTKPEAEIEEPKDEPEPEPEPEEPEPQRQPATPQAPTGEESQAGSDEGQTDVQAPAGGPISGAQVSDASFTYNYWFGLAFNKINQNYRQPFVIDGKVQCKLYFEVIKSGRVIDMRVLESSGIDAYDDACLGAIGRAAPFPPLPKDYLPEVIGLTITISNEY
jgi:protein TonB